ncbi:MAG TPA: carbohydrate-binding protein, partial [Fibrella sp.]
MNDINKRVPALAKLTVRPGFGHGGWNHVFIGDVTNDGKTIWDWMYQFDRSNPHFPKAGDGVTAGSSASMLSSTASTVAPKGVFVNLYRGSNAYANSQWNNWNVATAASFLNLKYNDGQASTISAALTNSATVYDNGSTYSTSGMTAPEVLRYTSRSTVTRTLTLTGLSPTKAYDLEFYASRNAVEIDATLFTINTSTFIIASDKNRTNKAVITSVWPDANGKISVNIRSAKAYNYLNGFKLTESASSEFQSGTGVVFPAVSYATMGGVATQTTTDVGGGLGVSSIDDGDWMDYSVETPVAGVYTLKLRLASSADGGQFIIKNTLGKSLATIYVPNTGGSQTWRDVSIALPLEAGLQTLRFQSTSATRWNFNRFQMVNDVTGQHALPISKVARPVTLGTVIEAENYMAMYGIGKYITSDFAGGSQNTTAIDLNDWMSYHITTEAAGIHILNLRVAADVSDAQFYIKDSSGKILTTVSVPNTGGWQTWRDVTAQVTLP